MRGLRVSVSSPGFFIDPDFIFFDLCGLFFYPHIFFLRSVTPWLEDSGFKL